MTLDLTRRSLLKFMGGAMAGAVLSPLPWKLLDDVSIWTQNNALIARLPRGPVSWRGGTCTLCPAGCGVRARLVGASLVSAWPQPRHPLGGGHLCPLGLASAQLRYHPARVRGAVQRDVRHADAPWQLVDPDAAAQEVGRRLAARQARGDGQGLAVLDLRPGRAMSRLYTEFLERQGGGLYLTLPDARQASAAALAGLLAAPAGEPALDLSRARSILSFGAPLHEGWLGAGAAPGLRSADPPRLIQVDTCATVTAMRADRWLAIRPGGEAPLALSIAHVLVEQSMRAEPRVVVLADAPWGSAGTCRSLLADFAPERTASATGLAPDLVRDVARDLAARRPALAIGVGDPSGGPLGDEEEAAVWLLNLILGAAGPDGPVAMAPTTASLFDEPASPPPHRLTDIPDGSLDLLLLDGSFPGAPLPSDLLRRKLSGPDAMLVALSPYAGGASAGADLILPTFAPGEWTQDGPTPALAPRSSYAWSPALAAPPDWARHPAEWLARLEDASGIVTAEGRGPARHQAVLAARVDALQTRGLGEIFDPRRAESLSPSTLAGPGSLAEALANGGCWTAPAEGRVDDADVRLLGTAGRWPQLWRTLARGRENGDGPTSGSGELLLQVGGGQAADTGAVAPPALTKLYRESGLKPEERRATINPTTARDRGLDDGATVLLQRGTLSLNVIVTLDASLPPGLVRMATGPSAAELGDAVDDPGNGTDILDFCGASRRPVWRLSRVQLREVRHA